MSNGKKELSVFPMPSITVVIEEKQKRYSVWKPALGQTNASIV
jgi:hypothetical protein